MNAAIEKRKSGEPREHRKISLTGNFIIYVIIFVVALIFTQALRSRASNMFFMFVFLLPLVMLLYVLTARATLKVYMLSDSATITKHDPYTYKLRVINESIFPYPFIEAVMHLPRTDSIRCAVRTVRIAMSPLVSYTIKNTVKFRFRGTYEIGVKHIYIYDFFRIIRMRLDIEMFDTISVLPRRLLLKPSEESAISDSARETKKDPNSYEKIEISDIREYMTGDPLKSIHWKLSSKAEDFLVRDYDTGSSKKTLVFCDMSARFPDTPPEREAPPRVKQKKKDKKKNKKLQDAQEEPQVDIELHDTGLGGEGAANEREQGDFSKAAQTPETVRAQSGARGHARRKKKKAAGKNGVDEASKQEEIDAVDINELADDKYYDDMNEYCADGVVELTVATVLRELNDNNECTLIWFDSRSEFRVYSFTLRGIEDFNAIYHLFATAPLSAAGDSVTRLSKTVSDTQDIKQIYITSAIDEEAVRDLFAMPSISDGASFGSSCVILYNPEERFTYISERKRYIESCRSQLMFRGLKLIEGKID